MVNEQTQLLKACYNTAALIVEILSRQIQFTTSEQTVEISKGQMLTLHKGIPHNVLAMEETIFLLTLTTTMDENK